jgi:hypothetical protein
MRSNLKEDEEWSQGQWGEISKKMRRDLKDNEEKFRRKWGEISRTMRRNLRTTRSKSQGRWMQPVSLTQQAYYIVQLHVLLNCCSCSFRQIFYIHFLYHTPQFLFISDHRDIIKSLCNITSQVAIILAFSIIVSDKNIFCWNSYFTCCPLCASDRIH